MMATVKIKYRGDLRVECEHVQSGTKLYTDAPTDNQGKGESFSPTDLCVTSLAAFLYDDRNGIIGKEYRGRYFRYGNRGGQENGSGPFASYRCYRFGLSYAGSGVFG